MNKSRARGECGVGIVRWRESRKVSDKVFRKHLKKILFVFRERGREGEREGGNHQCVVASCMLPTGDPGRNPGMCPDWELNW